jgi:hypothetical protein
MHDAYLRQMQGVAGAVQRDAPTLRATEQQGPVPETFRRIALLVDNVEKEYAALENRLELVLTPPVPQVSEDKCGEAAVSPLHDRMLGVEYRLASIWHRLQTLQSRVTL